MDQPSLFHDSIYDAIKAVVQAAGGNKKVGPMLRPTKAEPANWLRDCLNEGRREKLDPEDMAFLRKLGRDIGCHAITHHEAQQAGYEQPTPLDNEERARTLLDALSQYQAGQQAIANQLSELVKQYPGLLKVVA